MIHVDVASGLIDAILQKLKAWPTGCGPCLYYEGVIADQLLGNTQAPALGQKSIFCRIRVGIVIPFFNRNILIRVVYMYIYIYLNIHKPPLKKKRGGVFVSTFFAKLSTVFCRGPRLWPSKVVLRRTWRAIRAAPWGKKNPGNLLMAGQPGPPVHVPTYPPPQK